ncbi:cobyrinate a,c-diamide synthase [Marinivivus vitaminiproducens]|uniref:cobyrinate a,c-diamide synthase n=1 Tax=Marinivivus vitaminiproducens TaxID=3035935 RepID=UPI0027A968B1|nr:cobyrinate a,c-diamide synthase [Geminicoccaceae bacterium SCSIO 64248]
MNDIDAPPGVVIAAPASGSGKTLVTIGLIRALRAKGHAVASFKAGPDYIDPTLHAAASGRPSVNLDSWAMRPSLLAHLASHAGRGSDLLVGEGVMGLFDGAVSGQGSTADLAALLGLPVILVIDAKGMAASAAAVANGFIRHREDVEVAGIVFNRVGSPSHLDLLRRACDDHFSQPVLGGIPASSGLGLSSRHLGLVPAGEAADVEAVIAHAADLVLRHLDLERLVRLAKPVGLAVQGGPPVPLPPLGQHVAVARDDAFVFAYPHVLAGWREAGAEISFFSPLAGEAPDDGADAAYLPGGYPELHAPALASASPWRRALRRFADQGRPIFGECGGFMALGEGLIDTDGERHAMAGLLPLTTSFAAPKLHLGYRRLRSVADTPLGPPGTVLRGHLFHYATIAAQADGARPFESGNASGTNTGPLGLVRGSVFGSFAHLIDREA